MTPRNGSQDRRVIIIGNYKPLGFGKNMLQFYQSGRGRLVVFSEASLLRQCKVAEQIVHEQLSSPGGNASQPRLDQHIVVIVVVGGVVVTQDTPSLNSPKHVLEPCFQFPLTPDDADKDSNAGRLARRTN